MADKQRIAAVLNKAADLVAKGWTQGVLARSASGRRVDPKSTAAVSWCAVGAIGCAADNVDEERAAYVALSDALAGYPMVSEWNDAESRKRLGVVRKLRAAARKAAQ